MPIIEPSVFLDTWVLKNLARGAYPDALATLTSLVDRGKVRTIVTLDTVEDFCADGDQPRALREAGFVDKLNPLWMPPGIGILHREAYSEFRRLTNTPPLPDPFPCTGPIAALAQWIEDCPCTPSHGDMHQLASLYDVGASFAREVEYTYRVELLNPVIGRREMGKLRALFAQNRTWARQHQVNWEKYFRQTWVRLLAEPPALKPNADLARLSQETKLERMPALDVMIGLERAWHKDKKAKAKLSDMIDREHLALLPYVSIFICDRQQGSLIHQAKLAGRCARVYDSIDAFLRAM